VLALLAATPAAADVLYGIRGGNILIRIDTSTRISADVGTVAGFGSIGGLAFASDGTLYGLDTATDVLVRIDRSTAMGTLIGPLGAPATFSTGLGYDATADRLYGVTTQGTTPSGFLVRISRANGAASAVGNTLANALVGLGFDAIGQLWGIDGGGVAEELVRIDKATAARTVVGPRGLLAFPNIGSFDIGPSGALWAINSTGPELLQVNPGTGAPIVIGNVIGLAPGTIVTGLAAEIPCVLASQQNPRLGTPANPNAFLPGATPPAAGRTWDPIVDHNVFFPASIYDLMALSFAPVNVPTGIGTLLVDIGGPFLLFAKSPTVPFGVPVPPGCPLVGIRLFAQAASVTLGNVVGLTNALDLVIGSY
jgi:hypothetical protein